MRLNLTTRPFYGRSFMLALACGAFIVATATMALAKGPSQAVIEGPGISPISLRQPGDPTIGEALATMVQESGFFATLNGADAPWRHQRPEGKLGPRYVVTYTLGGRARPIIQHLYPYASAGPVTYMPPGQRSWGNENTTGGWHRADSSLTDLLTGIGVPARSPDATIETTPQRQAWPWDLVALVGAAVVAAALLLKIRRSTAIQH